MLYRDSLNTMYRNYMSERKCSVGGGREGGEDEKEEKTKGEWKGKNKEQRTKNYPRTHN